MLHVALANIRTYARRYIAAILAVAIGTAFLGASLAVDTSTRATLKNSVGEYYQSADVVAFKDFHKDDYGSERDKPLTLDLLTQIRALPEVETAYASSNFVVNLRTDNDLYNAWLIAMSPENRYSGMTLIEGRAPMNDTEASIDEKYAEQIGLHLGDQVAVEGHSEDGKPAEVRIVGFTAASNDPFKSSMMQLGVTEDFWEFLLQGDAEDGAEFDEIMVNGTGDITQTRQAVEQLLADRSVLSASVLTADEKVMEDVANLTNGTDQLTVILLIFALVALVVTGLVVMNTFAVVIAQRTRELALLRTLGAKRAQIRSSVLIEALLIGVLASVIGILAAIGLMAGLVKLLQVLVPEMSYATLGLDWRVILVPLLVGIVMTVLAAWLPARRAMKLAPLAALRPFDAASVKNRSGKIRIFFGALLAIAGGAGLFAGALLGSLPVAFLGGLLSFPGILMLASLFIPSTVFGVGKLMAGNSVAGKLAALNSVRNPGRTTATATALLIGVTLVSMIMVGGQSAKSSLNQGISEEYPIDLVVQNGNLKDADIATLREIDGIAAVAPYQGALAEIQMVEGESEQTNLLVVDPEQLGAVTKDDAALPRDGELFYTGWIPTEGTTALVDGEKLDLNVSSASYLSTMLTVNTAQKLGLQTIPEDGGAMLRLEESVATNQVSTVVDQIATELGIESAAIFGGAMESMMFSQIIDVLLMIVSGLLAVAVLIALIGVANTLSLSVLERTRENALLRALGLKKKQLRSMLAVEAVLIGGVAALLGLILGTIYGMFGAYSALSVMGQVRFDIPWLQLALVIGVSIIAALLASLTPSRRAARLSPVEGLATE